MFIVTANNVDINDEANHGPVIHLYTTLYKTKPSPVLYTTQSHGYNWVFVPMAYKYIEDSLLNTT